MILHIYRQQPCIEKKKQRGRFFHTSNTFVPQQNGIQLPANASQIELNNRVKRLLKSLSALDSYFYPPQPQQQQQQGNININNIGNNNMPSRRPKFFDGLLQLADPDKSQFVDILTEMGPQLSLRTQSSVQAKLANKLNEDVEPQLIEEDADCPIITFGRGLDETMSLNASKYRYIHPVTAVQTFAQFYHMSRKDEGCLRKLYPGDDEHKKILDCAELSHHILNGYASNLQQEEDEDNDEADHEDDEDDDEGDKEMKQTKKMTAALKQGLKIIGPPGSGKSQLLSVPILLALLNHIPILISFATKTAFTTLTIDFTNNRARSTLMLILF